jgi:hypothetical protein
MFSGWGKVREDISKMVIGNKVVIVRDVCDDEVLPFFSESKDALLKRKPSLLIYTLSSMLWQPDYMPRIPVGLLSGFGNILDATVSCARYRHGWGPRIGVLVSALTRPA